MWVSLGGGWVRRRCSVAFVTGSPNWYWLTVGQGLLSLQQVRIEGEWCYFFCSFTFFHFHLFPLSLSFIFSTISFLLFSGRRHKMNDKVWRVIKPQHNGYHQNWHGTGCKWCAKRSPFAMYDKWRPRSACAWSLPSLSICSTVDTNVLESDFLGWWFTVEPKYKYTKISLRLLSTIIIDQWNQTTHKMN